MRNHIIGLIWITIGIAFIYSGLSAYWQYSSSGILWLFVVLEIIQIKKIALGIISFFIGFSLTKNKDITRMLVSLSLWTLILEFAILLFDLYKYSSISLIRYSLQSILILTLVMISIKYCTRIKNPSQFISKIKNQIKRDILIGIALSVTVILLSMVIDYDVIESLRN